MNAKPQFQTSGESRGFAGTGRGLQSIRPPKRYVFGSLLILTFFLEGYQQTMSALERPWVTPEQLRPLLDLFLLERAAYEVGYEAANRVAWIDLPAGGLARLIRKLLGDADAQV